MKPRLKNFGDETRAAEKGINFIVATLVTFCCKNFTTTATIVKRIGIPIIDI